MRKNINWKDDNKALVNRGKITLWFPRDADKSWYAPPSGKWGSSYKYSDVANLMKGGWIIFVKEGRSNYVKTSGPEGTPSALLLDGVTWRLTLELLVPPDVFPEDLNQIGVWAHPSPRMALVAQRANPHDRLIVLRAFPPSRVAALELISAKIKTLDHMKWVW